MKIKELLKELNKYDLNNEVVIYSNEETLKGYQFLGTYKNVVPMGAEEQVEIHIDGGISLG